MPFGELHNVARALLGLYSSVHVTLASLFLDVASSY